MERCYNLQVSREPAEIPNLCEQIEDIASENALDTSTRFILLLCTDEIISNIINHGSSETVDDENELRIDLSLLISDQYAELTIIDNGQAFDSVDAPPPATTNGPLAARRAGGLGLHMVRNKLDAMSYQRQEGRNILVMRKNRA